MSNDNPALTAGAIERLTARATFVSRADSAVIYEDEAETILATEFPDLQIKLVVPDEKTKRHGQAVAAASLAAVER